MTTQLNASPRTIYCRDNLDIMRGINTDCIDLIYLDPPFNSNRTYTAPVGSSAEGAEFSDIFRQEDLKDEWVKDIESDSPQLHALLASIREFGALADYCYCAYMAVRLIECQRILKPTGSIYLHCDPTASHYLKVMMDVIFGRRNFRNEIVWCYTGPGSPQMRQFNRKHDIIFWYANGRKWVFNQDAVRIPHVDGAPHSGGFRWEDGSDMDAGIASEYGSKGKVPESWWPQERGNGLAIAARQKSQYVGYPTQKPLALLERIIMASSNEGDMVLDPFCGCATTCVAAERLGRQWIGIDVSVTAWELVKKRLAEQVPEDLFRGAPDFKTDPPTRAASEAAAGERYVYIMQNPDIQGMYKVGFSKDPEARAASVLAQSPRPTVVLHKRRTPHYRELERFMHDKYPRQREWLVGDLDDLRQDLDQWQPGQQTPGPDDG